MNVIQEQIARNRTVLLNKKSPASC